MKDSKPSANPIYKYLLFDLDNTLLDYDLAEESALLQTFHDYGLSKFHQQIKVKYTQINAAYWNAFEKKQTTIDRLKTDRFRDLISEIPYLQHLDPFQCGEKYLDHLSEQTSLIPGAWEILQYLSEKYELCLITNGISRVQHRRISKIGLDRYFHHVVISEEIGISKPDQEFFLHTLEEIGNPDKREILIIGDNLNSDIQGGLNAGMDACWFNPNCYPVPAHISPTYIISQLTELINILT